MTGSSVSKVPKNYAGSEMEESLLQAICSGELAAGTVLESTVVMAQKYNVSIKTAQKVLQKLSSAGFLIRRNGAPTVVAERNSGTIGLVLPNMGGKYSYEDSKVHYLTVGGILRGCNQNNLNMMVIHSGNSNLNIQKISQMNLSGIILVYPLESDLALLKALAKTGLPLICINLLNLELQRQHQYKFINFDYAAAGRKCWEYFRKHGVKRPAFFSRIPLNKFEHRQYLYEGMRDAAALDGVEVKLVEFDFLFAADRAMEHLNSERAVVEEALADSDAVLFGETREAEVYRSWGYENKNLCGFFDASSHIPYFSLDYEQIGINALSLLIGNVSPDISLSCEPDARNMNI